MREGGKKGEKGGRRGYKMKEYDKAASLPVGHAPTVKCSDRCNMYRHTTDAILSTLCTDIIHTHWSWEGADIQPCTGLPQTLVVINGNSECVAGTLHQACDLEGEVRSR